MNMLPSFKYQVGENHRTQFGSRYDTVCLIGEGRILAQKMDGAEETYLVANGFTLGRGIPVSALPLVDRLDFLMIDIVCLRSVNIWGMSEKQLKKALRNLNYPEYPQSELATD